MSEFKYGLYNDTIQRLYVVDVVTYDNSVAEEEGEVFRFMEFVDLFTCSLLDG